MTSIEKLYKLFEIAQAISTDSRCIQPKSLFFALKGENFNGNKFARSAIENGAGIAIIDEEEYFISKKTILVNDVLQTLKDLANLHRKKLGIPVLAITGSNGKTTTKELVSMVLSKKFKVSFTEGNLNNHIGVPLTLLKMNSETEFGVVEMGANHPGEISELCSIADPDFGIITNIGKAHLEGFGSFEGVIKTKAELFNYLKAKNGTVFYNLDNPILDSLTVGINNKITYGTHDAYLNGELVQSPVYVDIKVNFSKGALYLNSHLTGEYNFENLMAAACIGIYFKIDPLKIQKAIKKYQPSNNRSQLIRKNGLKIIMDAYNANPTSMQASIKSFLSNNQGNKILILGDMLELGKYSKKEHIEILELLKNKPLKNVFTVGKNFYEISKKFNFTSFINVNDLCSFLEKNPLKKGNLLIKGSRGIKLEKVLDFL